MRYAGIESKYVSVLVQPIFHQNGLRVKALPENFQKNDPFIKHRT